MQPCPGQAAIPAAAIRRRPSQRNLQGLQRSGRVPAGSLERPLPSGVSTVEPGAPRVHDQPGASARPGGACHGPSIRRPLPSPPAHEKNTGPTRRLRLRHRRIFLFRALFLSLPPPSPWLQSPRPPTARPSTRRRHNRRASLLPTRNPSSRRLRTPFATRIPGTREDESSRPPRIWLDDATAPPLEHSSASRLECPPCCSHCSSRNPQQPCRPFPV